MRETLFLCPSTEILVPKVRVMERPSWVLLRIDCPAKAAQSCVHCDHSPSCGSFKKGSKASTFSPQGNPNHSVHSTNTYGAPTMCWVYGHSEASKAPVLVEFTIQERTKDRVLSPNVPSLLITQVGPVAGDISLAPVGLPLV